ncbi:hypothetical protein LTR99_007205 [Exophiala xenobiotica]|uniref:Peptidase A1 domain-containing protein n=1 Tax=Vermiconidia calcicola TaxID=1690605 RepID=A0AAV9PVV7_9PEZI|nr:hypothetical protein LTR96_007845 [Exophiala xenobiotica]KAK5528063.1 hypothetical protein LTR25_010729 [Vermiconidia calcicola]KAK5532065.1 hypothetical protein LTR23_009727 [Chaetothyriales sp. CCFEE 6169]KAK5298937.1 hypothetical protein LTR99_007205 [Exophiala xenobiotica]KAK5334625.1 hypothetical protein LTR98_008998 [Exophiala xenobiotica]
MDNRRNSSLLALWLLVSAVYGAVSPMVLDLRAVPRANTGARNKVARRENPVRVDLAFHDNIFYANASLGTPQQHIQFIVDTNSADLLAPAPSDPACDNGACTFGTYKANSSSTYDFLTSNFSTQFGDGSTMKGDYATDVLQIGGVQIDDMRFAVGYEGTLADPIMGIGYYGLEPTANGKYYANLPYRMFDKGLSKVIGYSLFFNRANASADNPGQVIFGGVDTNKFYGTLGTIPISMSQLQYQYVTVQMEGMTVTSSNGTTSNITNKADSVVLDSGTSSLVLGDKQLSRLGEALGGINDTSIGGYFVQRYADLDNATTINFSFGGVNITVPVSDLILPYNNTWAFLNIVSNSGIGIDIIGLPFFRNAYTIFDYSHNQVSVAPLVQNSTSSNITTINENGVTGLVGVSLSSPSGNGGGGLSTGAKAGIGVGVAVGVLFILGLLVLLFLRRRRQQKSRTTAPDAGIIGFKAELPTSEQERQRVENDGASPLTTDREELPGTIKPPPAELYPGINGKSFETQELPGDVPKPHELATNTGVQDGKSGASGHSDSANQGVTDSAASDLTSAAPARAVRDHTHIPPTSHTGSAGSGTQNSKL